jgi:hypothetical protein
LCPIRFGGFLGDGQGLGDRLDTLVGAALGLGELFGVLAPDEALVLSLSASSRSAGPIHGSGWIEAKIS